MLVRRGTCDSDSWWWWYDRSSKGAGTYEKLEQNISKLEHERQQHINEYDKLLKK
jgi:hypothetical protein